MAGASIVLQFHRNQFFSDIELCERKRCYFGGSTRGERVVRCTRILVGFFLELVNNMSDAVLPAALNCKSDTTMHMRKSGESAGKPEDTKPQPIGSGPGVTSTSVVERHLSISQENVNESTTRLSLGGEADNPAMQSAKIPSSASKSFRSIWGYPHQSTSVESLVDSTGQ